MTASQQRALFEALAKRIEPGSKLLRTWALKGGVSAAVTAFELERAGGGRQRLIARRHGAADLNRNQRIAADEFRLLQLLRSAGVAAPTPRYLDSSGEIFSTPSLVVDYIEGDAVDAELQEAVPQLADKLAEIHRIDLSSVDLSFLPERELGAVPVPRSEESADLRRIRDMLQAAGALPRRNRSVLLHGDFWAGNTLWNDGRLVAVIDWEDAALGDPLADVANARLEILWASGIEAMEEFTRRYAAPMTTVDFADLPYWDLWADLRLTGHMAAWGVGEATENAMRTGHDVFVAQALEALAAR